MGLCWSSEGLPARRVDGAKGSVSQRGAGQATCAAVCQAQCVLLQAYWGWVPAQVSALNMPTAAGPQHMACGQHTCMCVSTNIKSLCQCRPRTWVVPDTAFVEATLDELDELLAVGLACRQADNNEGGRQALVRCWGRQVQQGRAGLLLTPCEQSLSQRYLAGGAVCLTQPAVHYFHTVCRALCAPVDHPTQQGGRRPTHLGGLGAFLPRSPWVAVAPQSNSLSWWQPWLWR